MAMSTKIKFYLFQVVLGIITLMSIILYDKFPKESYKTSKCIKWEDRELSPEEYLDERLDGALIGYLILGPFGAVAGSAAPKKISVCAQSLEVSNEQSYGGLMVEVLLMIIILSNCIYWANYD